MAYGKFFKKKAKQATKAVGKRYGISYGKKKGFQAKKGSVMKIAKDLMWVKSRLNVEKKFIDGVIFERSAVGQVDVNAVGYLNANLTPAISQGVQEANRVGNSIRATGMVLHMNAIKQAGAAGPRRIKVCVIRSFDPSRYLGLQLFDENPLTGLKDYHSNLDYTQLKDKTTQIIATRYIKLDEDGQATGQNDAVGTGEASTATIKIPIKLNDVMRYDSNGDSQPSNVRYSVMIFCDNGNKGLSASTNNGVLVKGVQSGVDIQLHRRFWYVDN